MRLFRTLLAAACTVGLFASPAQAERPRDQDRAYLNKQRGESLSLPQIERRVKPEMKGADHIGTEILRGRIIRMKFMQGPRVIWVDVDASTGRIVGKSGD